jgi:cytoskeletal protein RodZ
MTSTIIWAVVIFIVCALGVIIPINMAYKKNWQESSEESEQAVVDARSEDSQKLH